MTLTIDGLTVENQRDPLGVDRLGPRLGWRLHATRRDARQTAWQILVASSPQLLAEGRGDLWDSGKVASAQQSHVVYAGKPLSSRQACCWKARAWDAEGAGPWSPPARWEMGLLAAGDWTAKWIGRTRDTAYQPAPLLRREFTVRSPLARARAYVSGLGYYDLTVNGQRPDERLLDPGYTRYDRRALYATRDVTALLREGRNSLGVMLGTGWYNVHSMAVWYFDRAPWRAAPKLILQLHLDYLDGSSEVVNSDDAWKSATGAIVYDSIYGGETYDARLEKTGWDLPGFADHDWQPAMLVDGPGGILSSQAMPPIRVTHDFSPKSVNETRPGVFLVDFGQNIAGHVKLTLEGAAPGSEIILRYGEHRDATGALTTEKTGQHMVKTDPPQRFQTDRYICKGGTEQWEPRFTYHGGNLLEVSGWPQSGEHLLRTLRCRAHHDAWERAGTFSCSNELLNRIYDATLWSFRSNMQSIPTDCPHREKNGWTGDAHLACEQGLYNFASVNSYEKWLDDLFDEQTEQGVLPGIVPTSGWGYEWGNGPAWDSAYPLIAWYLYEYTGDVTALSRHYDRLKRYVDYLTSMAVDGGLVCFGLGDWLPAKTETPVKVTSTGYYYIDALIVARAAKLLGKSEDAVTYERLGASIKTAFNNAFLDAASGSYANGSQTAISCALYQGLVEPVQLPKVVQALIRAVEEKNNHIDCGILGAKYVLRALSEHGHVDIAYKIATQRDFPSWGQFIERGATTLWEDWVGLESLNHILFGDIVAWMYKFLAGIDTDPQNPGFSRVVIKPHPVGDLTWAKAEHISVHGRIAVAWQRTDSRFTLELEIPANTTAVVYIPAATAEAVREGGSLADASAGARFLRIDSAKGSDGPRVVYEVGSGSYRFEVADNPAAHSQTTL